MEYSRESVFVSGLRSLVVCFAAVVGLALGVMVLVLGVSALSDNVSTPDSSELVVSSDADGKRTLLAETTPVILRINLHGIVGQDAFSSEKIENLLLDSREGVLRHDRVKAILLHINTPGGIALDADGIYRALMDYKMKYKVPVYAYVDGLCASGGMYIAAAADKIYASADSVIGSVGVILGPSFNVYDAMQKIGVSALTLTAGKDKDALSPFRPWEKGEEKPLKDIVDALYTRFVDIVAENRPRLSRERLVNEYGARVYVASEAARLGYIDHGDSSYNQTLIDLVKEINLDNQKYQVLEIKPATSLLADLAKGKEGFFSRSIKHVFPLAPNLSTELSGQWLYLYIP